MSPHCRKEGLFSIKIEYKWHYTTVGGGRTGHYYSQIRFSNPILVLLDTALGTSIAEFDLHIPMKLYLESPHRDKVLKPGFQDFATPRSPLGMEDGKALYPDSRLRLGHSEQFEGHWIFISKCESRIIL